MTYKLAILIKNLKWAWKTKQPKYALNMIKAYVLSDKYHAWWKQQTVWMYREKTRDALAFSTSYEGLPQLGDRI